MVNLFAPSKTYASTPFILSNSHHIKRWSPLSNSPLEFFILQEVLLQAGNMAELLECISHAYNWLPSLRLCQPDIVAHSYKSQHLGGGDRSSEFKVITDYSGSIRPAWAVWDTGLRNGRWPVSVAGGLALWVKALATKPDHLSSHWFLEPNVVESSPLKFIPSRVRAHR